MIDRSSVVKKDIKIRIKVTKEEFIQEELRKGGQRDQALVDLSVLISTLDCFPFLDFFWFAPGSKAALICSRAR
jgi:hypothetical protein